MTTKELVKDLKEHIGCGVEVPLYDEELEVVVNALEKQIAKKLERYSSNIVGEMTFNCPSCNLEYYVTDYEDFNYCPNCGQKIDWRVEERNEEE